MQDEGLKALQMRRLGGPGGEPQRLQTRCAAVQTALMSVLATVDSGHTVVFDRARSFAVHNEMVLQKEFTRHEGGWDFHLELEAPELANVGLWRRFRPTRSRSSWRSARRRRRQSKRPGSCPALSAGGEAGASRKADGGRGEKERRRH